MHGNFDKGWARVGSERVLAFLATWPEPIGFGKHYPLPGFKSPNPPVLGRADRVGCYAHGSSQNWGFSHKLSSASSSSSHHHHNFISAIHSQLISLRFVGLKKSFVCQVSSLERELRNWGSLGEGGMRV